jgi:hypothetical protein
LHREPSEIRASMERLKIAGDFDPRCLDGIEGLHCHWRELFTDPEPIYTHLLQKPFDPMRHPELIAFNIQNQELIRWLQHAH